MQRHRQQQGSKLGEIDGRKEGRQTDRQATWGRPIGGQSIERVLQVEDVEFPGSTLKASCEVVACIFLGSSQI